MGRPWRGVLTVADPPKAPSIKLKIGKSSRTVMRLLFCGDSQQQSTSSLGAISDDRLVVHSGCSAQEDDMNTDTDNWDAFQAALQWQPDPVEIDLLHIHRKERGTDIISMLVAIYGSKELFINEYRCRPSSCTPHILRVPRCTVNSIWSSVRMYLLSHARCAP